MHRYMAGLVAAHCQKQAANPRSIWVLVRVPLIQLALRIPRLPKGKGHCRGASFSAIARSVADMMGQQIVAQPSTCCVTSIPSFRTCGAAFFTLGQPSVRP